MRELGSLHHPVKARPIGYLRVELNQRVALN